MSGITTSLTEVPALSGALGAGVMGAELGAAAGSSP